MEKQVSKKKDEEVTDHEEWEDEEWKGERKSNVIRKKEEEEEEEQEVTEFEAERKLIANKQRRGKRANKRNKGKKSIANKIAQKKQNKLQLQSHLCPNWTWVKDSRVRNNGVRRGRRKEWSERVVCYINCEDCKRVEDQDRWNFGAMTQKEFARREEEGLFSESCSVGERRAFYFKCDCKKCWGA